MGIPKDVADRYEKLIMDNEDSVVSRVVHLPAHDFRRNVVIASAQAASPVMSGSMFDLEADVSPFRQNLSKLNPEMTYRSMLVIAQFFVGRIALDASAGELIEAIGVQSFYQLISDSYGWTSDDTAFYASLLNHWSQQNATMAGITFGRRVAAVAGFQNDDPRWHIAIHGICTEAYGSSFMPRLEILGEGTPED